MLSKRILSKLTHKTLRRKLVTQLLIKRCETRTLGSVSVYSCWSKILKNQISSSARKSIRFRHSSNNSNRAREKLTAASSKLSEHRTLHPTMIMTHINVRAEQAKPMSKIWSLWWTSLEVRWRSSRKVRASWSLLLSFLGNRAWVKIILWERERCKPWIKGKTSLLQNSPICKLSCRKLREVSMSLQAGWKSAISTRTSTWIASIRGWINSATTCDNSCSSRHDTNNNNDQSRS